MIFLNVLKGVLLLLYLLLMVISVIFISKFIFQILANKGIKNIKIYDSVLIWQFNFANSDKDIYINIIPNVKQREEIREYFFGKKEFRRRKK